MSEQTELNTAVDHRTAVGSALDDLDLDLVRTRLEQSPRCIERAGRCIAFDIHNERGARTWFWFHGAPSSRLEALFVAGWARRNDIRVVALDRPGIGGTAPLGALTALSVVDDVAAVADVIGAERFTVLGGSAGGPYALACAHAFPSRLDGVVVTAPGGLAPGSRDVAGWIDRLADALAQRIPWLLSGYVRLLRIGSRLPSRLLRLGATGVEAPLLHAALDTGLGRTVLDEVLRQGGRGIVDDFRRLGSFGFSLADLEPRVLFVHGTRDPFVPARQTRRFAELVPASRYVELSGAGHGTAIFALDRIRDELKEMSARRA
ncbi:MAG: alpha/beta fold hydrolase [Myxococcota bacterium]